MARLSLAAQSLRSLLTPALKQEVVAEKLGVSQQAVSAWTTGRARPDPARMAQLEDLLGIPMRDWTEPAADTSPEDPAA